MSRSALTRYAWLSIAAALATMALKAAAYWLTGSVGLLSDAVESIVNLIGAGIALAMLTIAARPADDDHAYGHSKAEYFASGAEGALILLAAISIGVAAVNRLIHPQPLEQAGAGLAISTAASLINFFVARILLRAGKENNSITLEADARHLMTDVWTSAGVIAGIMAVALTGWQVLDPLIALAVAVNIVWSGYLLIKRSTRGSWIRRCRRKSLLKLCGFLKNTSRRACSTMPCAPGRPPPAASYRCTCWCPAPGRLTQAMICWSTWRPISAQPCRRSP